MAEDPRLEDLLDQYQELLEDGHVPSLEELSRDCPELRPALYRRVARLQQVGRILGDPPPFALPEANGDQPPLSLNDGKTWVSQSIEAKHPVQIPAPPGYEVVAPLGEGGMGIVYQARQVGLERLVALKMILGGSRARAVDLVRFRNEAQAIAALRHPNIVQVFEIGEFRGQPFFSLEFCAGGTLAKTLNGEPQPPYAAAVMVETLARAIHYAHCRGIVHRDLKPSNVLLSMEVVAANGETSTLAPANSADHRNAKVQIPTAALKITDFGLAKRVDDDSGKTQDGSVMGTPSYMAPEQAFGQTKDILPTTDVHALGAILYELLTGRPPFKGSTVHETLEQVRYREPVAVRELQPKVPVDLETICLKCLEKDPKKRYPTADALAEDLNRFVTSRPIKARPVSRLSRIWRWCRREPRTAGQIAMTAFMCIVIPALLVGYSIRLSSAEALLREQQKAVVAAQSAELSAREASETNRYFAGLSEAGRLRSAGLPGWTWEARLRVEEAAATNATPRDPVALRSELAAALAGIDLRQIGSVAEDLQAGAITFLPDGRLAIAPQLVWPLVPGRHILIIDPKTRNQVKLPFRVGFPSVKNVEKCNVLSASPDGRWLVLGLRGGAVYCWDLEQSDPTYATWKAHDRELKAIAFSPDSRWLYTGGADGRIRRWSIEDEKKMAEFPADGKPARRITSLTYWTGSRDVILARGEDGCRLLDPATLAEIPPAAGLVVPSLPGPGGQLVVHPPTGTIISSDGAELTATYWEHGICHPVRQFFDPDIEDIRAAHAGNIECLTIHPSGNLVVSACAKAGTAKLWHLGTGRLILNLPAPNCQAVAFSLDGGMLAVAGDHTTTLYEVGGDWAHTLLGRRGLPIRAIGLTGDGRIGTVASARLTDQSDRGNIAASIWDSEGKLLETVFHRAGAAGSGANERVASAPGSEWTAFTLADRSVIWWFRPGVPTSLVQPPAGAGPLTDLSVDREGRCWVIEGGSKLGVRAAGTGEKARPISLGWPWDGRKDLACVRASQNLVLVGCANGYMRIVPAAGNPVRDCACFDESPATLFTESANTVHAVDVLADETHAVAGTEDGRLWLFRLPNGEKIGGWAAHSDRVTTVAFDRTGEWLASGGRDRLVRLWRRSALGYTLYVSLEAPGAGRVQQVVFADNDRLLVLHENETAVRVWRLDRLAKAFRDAGIGR
jgi:serine/threonine protein kinase/WD40 repeat protein